VRFFGLRLLAGVFQPIIPIQKPKLLALNQWYYFKIPSGTAFGLQKMIQLPSLSYDFAGGGNHVFWRFLISNYQRRAGIDAGKCVRRVSRG
jgi:hypothetical protein